MTATATTTTPSDLLRIADLSAAGAHGGSINVVHDPRAAVDDADAVYTDVWVSMGEDAERERRVSDLQAYQVDDALMRAAAPEAVFMHCLPAHRGLEATAGSSTARRRSSGSRPRYASWREGFAASLA